LTGLKGVTDGRTDTSTMTKTRKALRTVARKNPAGPHMLHSLHCIIAWHRVRSELLHSYGFQCLFYYS